MDIGDHPFSTLVGSIGRLADNNVARCSVIGVALLLPYSEPLLAETDTVHINKSSTPRSGVIEEVIVTAQRRAQSIQDVPITMSAFTGDQLSNFGIVDTRDLEKIIPGFRYSESGFNVPIFTLRGVGFTEISQTASATVGLYIDEFNLPYPIMVKGPSLDISRMEVLKGPQGTLWGRNNTAGTINYITERPTEHFEAGLKGSYGRFQTSDIEGYISGPIINTLNARLAYRQVYSNEGWQKSLTRPSGPDGTLGEVNKWASRITIEWLTTENLDFTLAFSGWHDRSDAHAGAPIAIRAGNPFIGDEGLSADVRNHPTVPFDTNNMRTAEWVPQQGERSPEWQLDDKFRSQSFRMNYRLTDNATLSYLSMYGQFKSDESGIPTSGLSVHTANSVFNAETKYWSHEARMSGFWGNSIDYVFGIFASRDKVFDEWFAFTDQSSALFPLIFDQNRVANRVDSFVKQKADSEAIFINLDWQLRPSIGISFGTRYTREEREFQGCTLDSKHDTTPPPSFADFMNAVSIQRGGNGGAGRGDCITLDEETGNPGMVFKSLEEDNFSGRVSANWTPLDDQLIYLSYSRGFKSGSFPRGQGSSSELYNPVTQERLDAWELGGKLSLLNRALHVNFAAFHYDYRDKQLIGNTVDPTFGVLRRLENAPKSRIIGAELEIQASPITGLQVALSGTYLSPKVVRFTSINAEGELEDFSGNDLNNAPRWSSVFNMHYQRNLPFTNSIEFGVGFTYSYMGKNNSELSEDPLFKLTDYYNLDYRFSIGQIGQSWKVSFWGRNVTNEYQPVSTTHLGVADSVVRYAQKPQTYGFGFEYNF